MPAVSKKQQQFFGIVRAIQKGEQAPTTPETAKAAADMKKSDVKKFASTKHKGLPNKVVQKEGLDSNDKPFVKKLVGKLRKGSKTHAKQADDLEKAMKEESNPRIPRKKGQPAGSKKHSDLYTDENPKGTIHGLGFKDVATAKASVSKIRNSSRSHAHKIQAAVAMEQRAREMGKTSEAAVYRKFINTMKKKTKQMNEEGLRAWFGKSRSKGGKPGWVQVVSGKPCARQPGQKSTPKCVSSAKRASMTDAERKSAQRRKRAADPGQPQKSGAAKPTYVSTDKPKKKVSEAMNFTKFKSRAMDAAKKAVAKKSSSEYVGKRDAGAIAAKKMRDKEQQKYVGFLPANESVSEAKVEGGYISNVAKAQTRNERRFGDKGSTEPTGKTGQGTSSAAKMAVKRGEEHKARRGVKTKGMSEGSSYGLYKGSGKPSGAMAAFDKKEKEKKKEMKKEGLTMMILGKEVELKEKCWKGYEKKGMKTMFGKRYPNCVKKEAVEYTGPNKEDRKQIKKMDDPSYAKKLADYEKNMDPKKRQALKDKATKGMKFTHEEAEVVTEVKDKKGKGSGSKDACYHKVKSRYSVWPSAYASGALVKCRKVGAANWGNSSKKEEFSDWKSEFIWEDGDSEKKLTEDDMKGMSVKSGHKRPTKSGAGMTAKGVAAYRRRNPGSKLKTAVTTKPSKLKKGSKAANRRKSYCARSAGQMKKFPKAAKDPNSRLRQARRRWNC